MPLFVRAGSIVPTGPAIQHTGEGRGGPITLLLYTGADGDFSLYEDDGTSLGYAKGAFARIPMRYDEASRTLTIGAREGRFPGMVAKRTINVRWAGPDRPAPLSFDSTPDLVVNYDGRAQQLKLGIKD